MEVNALKLRKILQFIKLSEVKFSLSNKGIAISEDDEIILYLPWLADEKNISNLSIILDTGEILECLSDVRGRKSKVSLAIESDKGATITIDDSNSHYLNYRKGKFWNSWIEENDEFPDVITDTAGFYALCHMSKDFKQSPYIPMSNYAHFYCNGDKWQIDATSMFENVLYVQKRTATAGLLSPMCKKFSINYLHKIAEIVKEFKPEGSVRLLHFNNNLELCVPKEWRINIPLYSSEDMMLRAYDRPSTPSNEDEILNLLSKTASDIRFKERRIKNFLRPFKYFDADRFFCLVHQTENSTMQYTVSKKRTAN